MKSLKRFFRACWSVIVFALGFDGDIRKEATEDGLIDLSGEGRDTYGH